LQVFNDVSGQSLLVNLGWLAAPPDRRQLPELSFWPGELKLKAKIRFNEKGFQLSEHLLPVGADVQWPLRIQLLEINKIAELIGQPLLPFIAYLDKKETLGYKKNWHPIVISPKKNQAYAFQWFMLALAWLGLMTWAAVQFSYIKITKQERYD
jgi:cytochrome oxidase assembly protein ShyY1